MPDLTEFRDMMKGGKMTVKLTRKQQNEVNATVQKTVKGWQVPILRLKDISHAAEMAYFNGLPVEPAIISALKFVGANRNE